MKVNKVKPPEAMRTLKEEVMDVLPDTPLNAIRSTSIIGLLPRKVSPATLYEAIFELLGEGKVGVVETVTTKLYYRKSPA